MKPPRLLILRSFVLPLLLSSSLLVEPAPQAAFANDSRLITKCIPWDGLADSKSSDASSEPGTGEEPVFPLNPDTQCVIYSDIYAKFRMGILTDSSSTGIRSSISSVRECLRQKGFYTPPSSFLFWKLDPGGTRPGDGFLTALQACNQRVVSGTIQINTMSAQDLIRILEDPKACVDLQKKLAFPSPSTQGIGTCVVIHEGKQLPLNHAMTLVNVVCPPHRPMAQFRDPDTGTIVNLSLHTANSRGDKILMGTLQGIGEYSGIKVDLGLSTVEMISR